MSRFFNSRLNHLAPYVPGEQPRNTARLIKLNTNENPYPPGTKVQEALAGAGCDQLRLYPDPDTTALVEAAAQVYGVKSSQVLPGNGSDELLAFCFQAFGENGVCFSDISYGFYQVWAGLYGDNFTTIPLRENLQIAVDDYAGQQGTVIIANPNAPTGLALPLADIKRLLAQDPNRLVIVDEAYVDFNEENALGLLAEYENLLIIRTLSKGYSLAGARIGLAIGNAGIIDDLRRIKFSFNPYNINRLSILAGEAGLLDQEYFRLCRDRVIASRQKLRAALCELGFNVPDSRANFLFAGQHPQITAGEYYQALREQGILVRYFAAPRIDNFVRISIGTEDDTEELIQITRTILKGVE